MSGLEIFVDQDTGVNSSTCWAEGVNQPCATLKLGLQGLQHHNQSTLWVSNGSYLLQRSESEMDTDYQFTWMVDIVISARPVSVTVGVKCEEGTGLAFVYSSHITIRGVEFLGCGAYQYSTSRLTGDVQFEQLYVALYFLYASGITLESVTVAATPGTGVIMYNTVGTNLITNSTFTRNDPGNSTSGGGGLYIEFSYCAPALSENIQNCSLESNVPQQYVTNSQFFIVSCRFFNNSANEINSTYIIPQMDAHLAFGRGGGLSLFFKGNSANNYVSVGNSTFSFNHALWGGGIFVEYQDMSFNNTFSVQSSLVENNQCFHYSSEQKGTAGGGARLGLIFFNMTHASHNKMVFIDTTFSHNRAYYGGGLSLYTAQEPSESSPSNTLTFSNCVWESNIARVGSGVDLTLWHTVSNGATTTPNFIDCMFLTNTANYTSELGDYVGFGAFYSDSVPVNFHGTTTFEKNSQSALACIGVPLRFKSNSVTRFIANSGRNGGAVALMGNAFLEVSQNTTLYFERNRAKFFGGAIYDLSVGERDLISSRNCFIRYDNIEIKPWNWEVQFIFADNTASSKVNSIYATSLLTCLWGDPHSSTKDVFCWNDNSMNLTRWIYSSECEQEIATSPAKFVKVRNSTQDCLSDSLCDVSINVIPGLSTVLPFYTVDDRQNNVTNSTILTAIIATDAQHHDHENETVYINNTVYISDNSIEIHGEPNKSTYVKLETIAPRVISTVIKVNFSDCPPGMGISEIDGALTCVCEGDYGGLIQCHPFRYYAELRRGGWIGLDSGHYVAGECPYCALLTDELMLKLPQDLSSLQQQLCHSINRQGTLCSGCLPGYGLVVNGYDFDCKLCPVSEEAYGWALYLLTEFVPITAFYLFVVLFDVSVTSGPANAFVFFAQVLTAVFSVEADGLIGVPSVLKTLYTIPYEIWNQKFFYSIFPKFCLSSYITTLQLFCLGYVTAFYPLLLFALCSGTLYIHGRGVKIVVCLCKPLQKIFAKVRKLWDPNFQRSIVNALVTFIVFSYTKFTLVSFILLTPTPLLDKDGATVSSVLYYDGSIPFLGQKHIPYAVASFIVLLSFVALPPIALMAPSSFLAIKRLYKWVRGKELEFPSCCNNRLNLYFEQFLNAFHGCYKDGTGGSANNDVDCRWFAGLYFVLRLILFAVYAFTPNWFIQYAVQQLVCVGSALTFAIFQPYKRQLFNVVDISMFTILAAISTLSMFNYHVTTAEQALSMTWSVALQYVLIFLPLFYMVIYLLYLLYMKCKKCCTKQSHQALEEEDGEETLMVLAGEDARIQDLTTSYERLTSKHSTSMAQPMRNKPQVTIQEEERNIESHCASIQDNHGAGGYGAMGQNVGVLLLQETQAIADLGGNPNCTNTGSKYYTASSNAYSNRPLGESDSSA